MVLLTYTPILLLLPESCSVWTSGTCSESFSLQATNVDFLVLANYGTGRAKLEERRSRVPFRQDQEGPYTAMEARQTSDMSATKTMPPQPPPAGAADLAIYVQNLLQHMTDRFTSMSSNILRRIDELGTRIDELEKQIEDMMTQSGPNDGSPSKMTQH